MTYDTECPAFSLFLKRRTPFLHAAFLTTPWFGLTVACGEAQSKKDTNELRRLER
jgi:hypothetical protein